MWRIGCHINVSTIKLETEINILFLHANNSYEQALTIGHGGSKRNILGPHDQT